MEPSFEVLPPGQQRPPPPPPKRAKGGPQAWLAAAFLFLLKFKTVASMLVSIWAYSFAWGWPFAIGFVLLIFVHEMGHVIAAKWLGIPVSAPLFIPFFGAAIAMKQNPRDAWTEALMAYGGPLAGGAGSLLVWWAGLQWDNLLLLALARAGFALNLFNLIPIPPLDGGRICAAVSPWFWLLGLGLLAASLLFFQASIVSLIVIALVFFFAFQRVKQTFLLRHSPEMQRYYATHISNRLTMALMYLGLIAGLLLGLWDAHAHLQALAD